MARKVAQLWQEIAAKKGLSVSNDNCCIVCCGCSNDNCSNVFSGNSGAVAAEAVLMELKIDYVRLFAATVFSSVKPHLSALTFRLRACFYGRPKNAFVPIERVHSVNTYSRISTVLQGSEQSD